MDPEERKDLAEAAGEGDEEALEELRAEHVEAIRAMIEVLDDEDARQMIGLGIMLAQISEIGQIDFSNDKGVKPFELEQHSLAEKGNTLAAGPPNLDMVQEQLEAQLQHWSAWGLDEHTD